MILFKTYKDLIIILIEELIIFQIHCYVFLQVHRDHEVNRIILYRNYE